MLKKGITAVSVAIICLIIIILLGTVTINAHKSIQSANKIAFALEIVNIQEEVYNYEEENGDYPIGTNEYVINLSGVNTSAMTQFDGETSVNNEITVYQVDMLAIGIEDTEFGNQKDDKDVYVLSKETGKVYYLKGVKYNGATYYTLTEELIDINQENVEINEETQNNEITIFCDDTLTINKISDSQKEIYLSNIDVLGEDIITFKYETTIIPEVDAKSYFKNQGKTIYGDRIKLNEETDITLYAEDKNGNYEVLHKNFVN